jgi:hypothetical protein
VREMFPGDRSKEHARPELQLWESECDSVGSFNKRLSDAISSKIWLTPAVFDERSRLPDFRCGTNFYGVDLAFDLDFGFQHSADIWAKELSSNGSKSLDLAGRLNWWGDSLW